MRLQDSAFRTVAASGQFPHFARLFDRNLEAVDVDFNRLFEIGLAALLDGFAQRIES